MFVRSLLLLLLCVATSARADSPRVRTGPSSREAGEIARGWLLQQADAPGAGELFERDRLVSRRGVTHLYLGQRLAGREIFRAGVTATVGPDGRLRVARGRLLRGAAHRSRAMGVSLSAPQAVARASQAMALPLELLSAGLPPELVWFPVGSEGLRLGWRLALRTADDSRWWGVVVDAGNGTLLFRNPWTASDSYRTHAPPLMNPDEGARILAVNPASPFWSPFGWHDLDGVPGANSTDSTGNNVWAQEDADANNTGGFVALGGPTRDFDHPFEGWRPPETYLAASITQLFYLNNWLHDVHAAYGFDEAGGNFQQVNYGPFGLDGDPVDADTHDGALELANNANFSTAPDGQNARMQMGLFLDTRLVVSQPLTIDGTYNGGRALFGRALELPGTSGQLVQALDIDEDGGGAVNTTTDACSPLTNAGAIGGRIAFVDRGSCFFTVKVANAQAAGAIGVVVANNSLDPPLVTMSGDDPAITIPSVSLTLANGNLIRAQLGVGVMGTLAGFARDGSMDIGVVAHEYGHGVSNRLTGGPSTVDCLSLTQSRGMGEGWSDLWALAFTAKPAHTRTTNRYIGAYLYHQGPSGPGLRAYPYTTNIALNPLTYSDLTTSAQVHFVGTIWASALWELWWNLVEPHGLDPDVMAGNGGNNTMLELVMDGLKLQDCEPTFLDARDAIVDADEIANEGDNRCRIWTAFAKRGMGVSAFDGGVASSQAVVEAFNLPPGCMLCGDVDDNEAVNLRDFAIGARALAGREPGFVAPEKCNTLGAANVGDTNGDGVLNDCTPLDVATLRDYLAGTIGSVPAVCAPAVGIFR